MYGIIKPYITVCLAVRNGGFMKRQSNTKKVYLYGRLSHEDELAGDSNSIINQRKILTKYAEDNGFENYEFIYDDGYSGANFDRPSFMQMLDEVEAGNVSTIIVKDFSRFGRNYLEVGDYLEQVFPFLGVRFLSVNDGYDSSRNNGITAGIDIGLKNLIYDMYSKDLSVKVKSGKLTKMKKGEFIGSFAPYGYVKSKQRKNFLEIDEEAAVVVCKIFQLAVEGNNTTAIARILNAEMIPTPVEHYKKNYNNKKFERYAGAYNIWKARVVLRILKDTSYIGTTVNHKRERLDVGSKTTIKVPKEKRIVVDNTHEPIVSTEVFEKAQEVIRKITPYRQKPGRKNLFSGKIKCGNCKNALQHTKVKSPYYKCRNVFFEENTLCFKGIVYEETVTATVIEAIRKQSSFANTIEMLISKATKQSEAELANLVQQIKLAEQQKAQADNLLIEQFDRYLEGNISKDEYFAVRDEFNSKITSLSAHISELKSAHELQLLKQNDKQNQFVENFKEHQELKELGRELIEKLIDVIYIYDEKHIEIVWNFTDDSSALIGL